MERRMDKLVGNCEWIHEWMGLVDECMDRLIGR